MAKRRSRSRRVEPASTFEDPSSNPESLGPNYAGLDSDQGLGAASSNITTGRKIVTILSDDPEDKQKVVEYFSARDVSDVLRAADFDESDIDVEQAESSEAVLLDNLPILVLNESPNMETAMRSHPASLEEEEIRRLFVIEDELRYFPTCPDGFGGMSPSPDQPGLEFAPSNPDAASPGLSPYHQGYLRGLQAVINGLLGGSGPASARLFEESAGMISPMANCFNDTSSATWGIQATGVVQSTLSGRGIRVAILDTGFEFGHSDPGFASRIVAHSSFVGGTAQDRNGHGTHVAGTACGPRAPGLGTRRYGIASEADIFIGRVLGTNGGNDSTILFGINWAIGQRCDLINMSLGPQICRLPQPFSRSHEKAAQEALKNGLLMIAAAGNNSERPGRVCPVLGPAAAPSIVAVASVDRCARVASFSNQGQNQSGGEINFAAPGVSVFSAWLNPTRHQSISGTSMAAPHVTGIAALIAQETGLRGLPLYREMRNRAINIGGSRSDFGNGFIHV